MLCCFLVSLQDKVLILSLWLLRWRPEGLFANHTVATGGGKRLPPPELLVQQEVSLTPYGPRVA